MTIKVSKQLATMQDLAIGVGQVVQRRNGIDLTLDKIDLATNTEVQDRVIRVTSIAAMEAYSVPAGYVFSLNAGGRSGTFDVVAGDFSTELAADTLNGIYVGLADNPTATSKVAKRRIGTVVSLDWFGAVGDAITDDTAALQAAIDYSQIDNSALFLSSKTYRTTSTVTGLRPISIKGTYPSAYIGPPVAPDPIGGGSWLFFDHAAIGLFFDGDGTTLGTVYLDQFGTFRNQPTPDTGWVPGDFDFDISCDNVDLVIGDLMLLNPTRGLRMLNGSYGRLSIRRLRGQPLLTGIDLDDQFDSPRIGEIHFWPFWRDQQDVHNYTLQNLDCLVFGRVDNPSIESFFSIFSRSGLYLVESVNGVTNKFKLGNFEVDRSKNGIIIGAGVTTAITGLVSNFVFQGEASASDTTGIIILGDNPNISFGNVQIFNTEGNAIRSVDGTGAILKISNLSIRNYDNSGLGFPAVEIAGNNILDIANIPDVVKVATASIFAGNVNARLSSGTVSATTDAAGLISFSHSAQITPNKVFIQMLTDSPLFTVVPLISPSYILIRVFNTAGDTQNSTAVTFCWQASY